MSVMNDLHKDIALVLLERIRSGEAKPADLNVARQFLKDNNITAGPKNKPLNDLTAELDDLPDFEERSDNIPSQ